MPSIRRAAAIVLGLGLLVAACDPAAAPPAASEASPSSATASAIPGVGDPLDLRYTCGAFPFAPGLLSAGAGNDEQADTAAAAALRAHLALEGPDFDSLPDRGWHLAGTDARSAEFVTVDGDLVKSVVVANGADGWKVSGWGECQPRIHLPAGLGAAEWTFDPAQAKPGPATQVFDALVTELSCNSGQPADGRIVGPQIVKSADTVLVIFAVTPRPGTHDCQSNPPTRAMFDLGEPLGERGLFDGGRFPPGDPAVPRS
jgi:hypothetical protein